MKIGVQTWGSHGDIRPFVALAEGLQAAGNDVHLVVTGVDDACRNLVSKGGVRISVVASPVLTPAQQEEVARMAYGIRNPMTQMAAILRLCFAPVEDAMFAAAQRLCVESDVVIGHDFMHPLYIAAQAAGRPYVSVLLSSAAIPCDFKHPIRVPGAGRRVNRLRWWLTRAALHRTLKHYPDRLRRKLGMAPVDDVVTQVWLSRDLTLVAVSPVICPAQPDWPDGASVCGFLDTPALALDGGLPAALAPFLAGGPAPVCMTFGSWMPADRAGQTRALQLLTDAARLAGCRAIIQSPSAEACGFVSGADMLFVATALHHALFPRCRAVVHHGGAGTTQAVMRAGIPSVVVPNISEQEHWGLELQRLGVAVKPLRRRRATAAALARRIRAVLADTDLATRAHAVADAMRAERGVDTAVALVMQMFGTRPVDVKAG